VRDPQLRAEAVGAVSRAADGLGWRTAGVCASPLPGPSGNVEFFLWLRREPQHVLDTDEINALVAAAEVGDA
jgi:23S rRNA (cytidine1920-2'-O)/16S rRNA (cytidine1409-2'-O)-methyltransferase